MICPLVFFLVAVGTDDYAQVIGGSMALKWFLPGAAFIGLVGGLVTLLFRWKPSHQHQTSWVAVELPKRISRRLIGQPRQPGLEA